MSKKNKFQHKKVKILGICWQYYYKIWLFKSKNWKNNIYKNKKRDFKYNKLLNQKQCICFKKIGWICNKMIKLRFNTIWFLSKSWFEFKIKYLL